MMLSNEREQATKRQLQSLLKEILPKHVRLGGAWGVLCELDMCVAGVRGDKHKDILPKHVRLWGAGHASVLDIYMMGVTRARSSCRACLKEALPEMCVGGTGCA